MVIIILIIFVISSSLAVKLFTYIMERRDVEREDMKRKGTNKEHIFGIPDYSYVVFYHDRTQVIAGYPQIAFRTVRSSSADGVIEFMKSMGVKEEDIQSIDKKE